MILYVNGDSHSAGAEAAHTAAFAEDDRRYHHLGRRPHPENLAVSYGNVLANKLNAELVCDAESASSNQRILRTTLDYLLGADNEATHTGVLVNQPDLLIIGWATWEREEWWDEGTNRFWQVNAGGIGHDWPDSIKSKYKQWVIDQMEPEVINKKLIQMHDLVHHLHLTLNAFGVPHLFFNTYLDFSHLKHLGVDEFEWDSSYIAPYNPEYNYFNWLKDQGFRTATRNSYHFGADAHTAWADFLYANYVQNLLTN
jgi:hypothetical protein